MEKFIPFDKLSKKKQREQNAKRRGSWHGLNPVTRKPENSRAYNRQKARKWNEDSMTVPFVIYGEGRYHCCSVPALVKSCVSLSRNAASCSGLRFDGPFSLPPALRIFFAV